MNEKTPASVLMYATGWCGYCARARRLLKQKGVTWQEFDVGTEPDRRAEMIARSGRTAVPQIWVGARHIGGCDELHALERSGELDALLAGEPD